MSGAITYSSDINSPKGLKLDLVDGRADNEALKCIYCHLFLRDPIQNENGDRCCILCYKHHRNLAGEEVEDDYFFDKFAIKSLNKLIVFCSNKNNGCKWKGSYQELNENHLKECQYTNIQCELCKEFYPMIDKIHKTCRYVECPYCGDTILKKNIEKHYNLCQYAPEPCHFCKERVADQITHMANCNQAECVFQFFGCDGHQGNSSEEVQSKHNHLIFGLVQKLLDEKQRLENTVKKLKKNSASLKEDVGKLRAENEVLLQTNQALLQRYDTSLTQVDYLKTKSQQIDGEIAKLSDEINRRVKGAPNSVLFKDRLASIDQSYSQLNQTLSDLDLRLQLLDNKYVEGKITWKIDNIQFRIAQARNGEVTALHSAPCYTSQHGYKFCVRVYLDGDGVGKGSHVSLFFVLMKSEYDDILEWPFKRTIKFELINVEEPNKSVIETFQTDVTSSSFKKPDRDMNIAAGCPLFIPNEKFKNGNFIHRDCIYVRATVIEHHDMRFSTY